MSDCGVLAETADGKVVTSQWIDPDHAIDFGEGNAAPAGAAPGSDVLQVSGPLHYVVMKVFTPGRMIVFRLFMLIFGWNTAIAYWTKGWIRRLLMTRSGAARARFKRTLRFAEDRVTVTDRIERGGGPAFRRVKIGDDFSVRYVPQSRYFQQFELGVSGSYLSDEDVARLNRDGAIEITRVLDATRGLAGYATEEKE